MIDLAMRAVTQDLNAFFRRRKGDSRDRVTLGGLSGGTGNASGDGEDSIAFMVVRIAEEKNISARAGTERGPGLVGRSTPPVYLNLDVLFASMYKRYETGLKALSEVIAYMQAKPVFTPQNTPDMDPSLGPLHFEMFSPDYAQQSYLWGCLGSNYLPSACYTLRMLTVGQDQLQALEPAILEPNASGLPGVAQ